MSRFCVLASGSGGNAAFLQVAGFGLLIDIGIGPRMLASRLATIGASWKDVNAVLLTHTHTDHWKDRTLAQLRSCKLPLYCHPRHLETLSFAESFQPLKAAGLIRPFEADRSFTLADRLTCRALPIPHDSDPTFGFRIDGGASLFGGSWSLGYAADLGMMPPPLVEAFQDVNVLALEFNHDEEMECRSGRPAHLIQRVLGEHGHLSNHQGAEALGHILRTSTSGKLRQLVQLHLSHQCNRPALAQTAARSVLDAHLHPVEIITASQDRPTRVIELDVDVEAKFSSRSA
ncbi:MAG: MBL fold metallo-hydrolase [Planctomycetes bacterium]|nr:MBL fold metallo-hydrolase [Planctomycetota bacterium]